LRDGIHDIDLGKPKDGAPKNAREHDTFDLGAGTIHLISRREADSVGRNAFKRNVLVELDLLVGWIISMPTSLIDVFETKDETIIEIEKLEAADILAALRPAHPQYSLGHMPTCGSEHSLRRCCRRDRPYVSCRRKGMCHAQSATRHGTGPATARGSPSLLPARQ
jgi:hypothetical protein